MSMNESNLHVVSCTQHTGVTFNPGIPLNIQFVSRPQHVNRMVGNIHCSGNLSTCLHSKVARSSCMSGVVWRYVVSKGIKPLVHVCPETDIVCRIYVVKQEIECSIKYTLYCRTMPLYVRALCIDYSVNYTHLCTRKSCLYRLSI